MRHEGAVLLLGDLMRGNLTLEAENEVLAHVTGCEECRSLSATYATLSEAFADDPDSSHPPSEAIVDYALQAPRLANDRRERIAAHLASCPACALDVDTTAEVEADLAPARDHDSRRLQDLGKRRSLAGRGWPLAAAALAAGVMLLSYPAWLGVRRPAAPAIGGTWSGAVGLPLLQGPLRSPGGEVVEVAQGQPLVPLAVPAPSDESAAPVRFIVRAASGDVVWETELGAAEVARHSRSAGVVTLMIPAAHLLPGPYVLHVNDRNGTGMLEAPFRVVLQGRPTATNAPQ